MTAPTLYPAIACGRAFNRVVRRHMRLVRHARLLAREAPMKFERFGEPSQQKHLPCVRNSMGAHRPENTALYGVMERHADAFLMAGFTSQLGVAERSPT
jgi:hypothetical protein